MAVSQHPGSSGQHPVADTGLFLKKMLWGLLKINFMGIAMFPILVIILHVGGWQHNVIHTRMAATKQHLQHSAQTSHDTGL